MSLALERLVAGTPIPFAGNRVTVVSPELAARFQPGDHLLVEQVSGELLLIPVADQQAASVAIERAAAAFTALSAVSDEAISQFSTCLRNVWKPLRAGHTSKPPTARTSNGPRRAVVPPPDCSPMSACVAT